LPLSQAQSHGAATNQAVLGLVQTGSPFFVAAPSIASRQKIFSNFQKKDPYLSAVKLLLGIPLAKKRFSSTKLRRSKGFTVNDSAGTYSVRVYDTDNPSVAFDLTLVMVFRTATGQVILGDDFSALHQVNMAISGFDTEKGIRLTYSNTNFVFQSLGADSFTVNGFGTITASDGGSFALFVTNIITSISTGIITGGQVKISGNDGEKSVEVISTFQPSGVPIIEVKDGGTLVETQVVALPTVTKNSGSTVFDSTSAFITHPFVGDVLQKGTKVYSGYLGSEPINISISKSNALAVVCDISTRRIYTAAALDGVSVAVESYIAQDTEGNVWDLGSADLPVKNCDSLDLSLPASLDNGRTWNESFDGLAASSTVMGSDLSYQGFSGLKWIKTTASGVLEGVSISIVADVYLNTTYGEAFLEGSVTAQDTSVAFRLSRVP